MINDDIMAQCVGGMWIKAGGTVLPVPHYAGHTNTLMAFTCFSGNHEALRNGWVRVGFPMSRGSRVYIEFSSRITPEAQRTLRQLLRTPCLYEYAGMSLDMTDTAGTYLGISATDSLNDADVQTLSVRWLNRMMAKITTGQDTFA